MSAYPGAERLEGRLLFAAGDLDPTFGGGDGVADLVGAGRVHAIAFTDDSAIVVAGCTPIPPFGGGQGLKLRVVRYRPDGTLDTSFGVGGDDGDGVVTVDDVTANGGSTVLAMDPLGGSSSRSKGRSSSASRPTENSTRPSARTGRPGPTSATLRLPTRSHFKPTARSSSAPT